MTDGPTVVTALPDSGAGCDAWGLSGLPSGFMSPGHPCLDCHDQPIGSAPAMTIAGTVFDGLRARDNCKGIEDVNVIVTDDDGQQLRLHTNRAGNFYSSRDVAFPITARLEMNGRVREMGVEVGRGDCNSCHTQQGDEMAPGRIVTPTVP